MLRHLFCTSLLGVSASALATSPHQPPFLNHTLSWNQTSISNHTLVEDAGGNAQDASALCDYSVSFDKLADLQDAINAPSGSSKAKGTMRTDCIAAYALETLINMLDTAYHNYTVVNDGYNKEFGFYITYMKDVVTSTLNDAIMFDVSNANSNEEIAPLGPGMQYFDCKIAGQGDKFPCSQIISGNHARDMSTQTTTLTLKDPDGYNETLSKAGINLDWVHFGDQTIEHDIVEPHGGRAIQYKFSGFPVEKANMVVPNPKDIVQKALPSIPQLRTDMQATLLDIWLGQYIDGSVSDAPEAYSTPVFMLMQAVHGMAQAKALGQKQQKIEEQARINFIVEIVSAVLVFIPVIGEEAAALVGLADLPRAIAIAGEVGNAALAIYDTVTNPASAVINILGLLVGAGTIAKVARDAPGLAKVAKLQRGMDSASVAKLGGVFKNGVDELNPIMKVCKWS